MYIIKNWPKTAGSFHANYAFFEGFEIPGTPRFLDNLFNDETDPKVKVCTFSSSVQKGERSSMYSSFGACADTCSNTDIAVVVVFVSERTDKKNFSGSPWNSSHSWVPWSGIRRRVMAGR